MTLIDDYQAAYKLRGALLALDLLENVPVTILKRTGISQLLLTVCLYYIMILGLGLSFTLDSR